MYFLVEVDVVIQSLQVVILLAFEYLHEVGVSLEGQHDEVGVLLTRLGEQLNRGEGSDLELDRLEMRLNLALEGVDHNGADSVEAEFKLDFRDGLVLLL